MDDLLAEINSQKRKISAATSNTKKTFANRAELSPPKVQAKKTESIITKATEETKLDVKSNPSDPDVLPHLSKSHKIVPRDEVISRLRSRGAPIRLFGETDAESYHRLRLIELTDTDDNQGLGNDFLSALDKLDQDSTFMSDHESDNENDADEFKTKKKKIVYTENDFHTLVKLVDQMGKVDSVVDSNIILSFFQIISGLWLEELKSRPMEVKTSHQGKLEAARYEQTRTYLKPLTKKLSSNSLSSDILEYMTEIVSSCLVRNYVQANDCYLRMSIGNAPWPIGVTMVGIHARTGREKIFSQHVAHVMNDETQRKYIQAVKRLMTFCQKSFPTDPSRCVEFVPDPQK